jgi:uncharacterized protein (DUF1501 family)
VKGGRILGKYPATLTEVDLGKNARPHSRTEMPNQIIMRKNAPQESPLNIGRGRLLPTSPWEAMYQGVLEWFGVPASQMATVLPNARNFPAELLFSQAELL